MGQLQLLDNNGKSVGELKLKAKVFEVVPKESVVHSALVAHLADLRGGNASTKTRGLIRGGGKKPWRQKGTGRARAGTSRSPLWRGGGVIFGPSPRSFKSKLPKKIRKLALRMALSDKFGQSKIKALAEIKTSGKTKEMVSILKGLGLSGKILVLVSAENDTAVRAARNIKGVVVKEATTVNIFDLLHCEQVLAEKTALQQLEGALSEKS